MARVDAEFCQRISVKAMVCREEYEHTTFKEGWFFFEVFCLFHFTTHIVKTTVVIMVVETTRVVLVRDRFVPTTLLSLHEELDLQSCTTCTYMHL